MSEHRARITWQRSTQDFTYQTYNRSHEWQFTTVTVPASAAKEYRGDEKRVNPEEALVAALSSCHMLTFLALAARRNLSIDAYEDTRSVCSRRTRPASSRLLASPCGRESFGPLV